MLTDRWWSCYGDGLKGQIVDEAFCHPAKMSWSLVNRILDHAMELGWVSRETVCLDPFGGVGVTALACSHRGIPSVGIELERHFFDLAHQNFALHRAKWERMGYPPPVFLRGDSRRLREILGTQGVGCCVTSPPYANKTELGRHGNLEREMNLPAADRMGRSAWGAGYSRPAVAITSIDKNSCNIYTGSQEVDCHEETIGSGCQGTLESVLEGTITNPTLGAIQGASGDDSESYDESGTFAQDEIAGGRFGVQERKKDPICDFRSGSLGVEGRFGDETVPEGDREESVRDVRLSPKLGDSPQGLRSRERRSEEPTSALRSLPHESSQESILGRDQGRKDAAEVETPLWVDSPKLIVTSPPYAEGLSKEHTYADHDLREITSHRNIMREKGIADPMYGTTPGQLGAMKPGDVGAVIRACITSPPYAEGLSKEHTYADEQRRLTSSHRTIMVEKGIADPQYGHTEGQLGQMSSTTYWQAVAEVYHACYDILPPQGHMIVVVKGYVRKGKLVDLPGQTADLLQAIGFTILHRHEAMLSARHGQGRLDGGEDRTGRKSFFRRNQEDRDFAKAEWPNATDEEMVQAVLESYCMKPLKRRLEIARKAVWKRHGKPRHDIQTEIVSETVLCAERPSVAGVRTP